MNKFNIIIYDLETTGLDYQKDKIIEIYMLNLKTNRHLHYLINPGFKLDKSIKVNNITNNDLLNKPKFIDIYDNILNFCSENAYLISHNNINFDKRFLEFEFLNIKKSFPKNWKYIDTLHIARHLYPNMSNYKLDTLRDKFNIDKIGNHRANKDVNDLYKIYKIMTKNKNIYDISLKTINKK